MTEIAISVYWKMVRKSTLTFCLVLGICIVMVGSVMAAERFQIRSDPDTAYLPYSLDIRFDDAESPHYVNPMATRLRVLTPAVMGLSQGRYSRGSNSSSGQSGWFTDHIYPEMKDTDDDGVGCAIRQWRVCKDDSTGEDAIIGTGNIGDTAVLFRSYVHRDYGVEYLHLYSRPNANNAYSVNTILLRLGDYDYDGHLEAFVFVSDETNARVLYCIDLVEWAVEWSLSVASNMVSGLLQFTHNKRNPGVILTTINPSNLMVDDNFNDYYSYLTVVDSGGHIRSNRKIGRYPNWASVLSPGEIDGVYYFTHLREVVGNEQRPDDSTWYLLSKVDASGATVNSIPLMGRPGSPSTVPYGKERKLSVLVQLANGQVAVYDTNLTLVAISDSVGQPFEHIGMIRIAGEADPAYVCRDGIYDVQFEKIVMFPFPCNEFEPIMVDTLGNTVDLVLRTWNRSIIAHISKKNAIDLVGVFYHRNQVYILMAMSGLLVGLVMTSVSRSRTKRNLATIAEQKLDLEKTHQKLIDTQQKLIEAEKYKQAKDIAGGFAHEIRNALFPADGLLTKLRRSRIKDTRGEETISDYNRDVHKAITHAIDITQLISDYTRLDTEHMPELADIASITREVVEDNRLKIDEIGVMVSVEGVDNLPVSVNRKQLRIVMNNLLLNSLDAVSGRSDPTVRIKLETTSESVEVSFGDNGVGIPPENLPRVFETFFSTKPNTGTGLGLAMVRKIVEMYSGLISVTSEPDLSTEFKIKWPLARATGEA